MKKTGFTLIELVVVIALIAILAVTLVPRLRDQIAKSKDVQSISTLGALRGLSETYFADTGIKTYGDLLPSKENNFDKVEKSDEYGLALLIPDLSYQGMKLFGVENGVWTSADGYAVEIGGARDTMNGEIKFNGEIGYTFHAPVDTSADGISLWFTKYTLSPDGLEFDTKGLRWIEY